ncbi:MAG: T9SS type A sorting domain-containing protein, partial [Bacteroidia bacterium]
VGSTDVGDGRPYGGYISEIIGYRTALNKASRIIVNNYLSAKYNISLSANDKYAGDTPANGDFDREVAGVGSDTIQPGSVVGSNTSFASSVAGGLGITVNSGLDVGDYILAGYADPSNQQITTDVSGMSGTANARWERVWYIDVTNTSTSINTNIEFDMSDGGVGALTLGTLSNYELLYRASNASGTAWTELTTASAITGDKVQFNGYNLTLDGYYTIGTKNYPVSPLPIELLNFNAIMNNGKVDLNWTTATESNNNYFTIEKSKDGVDFETVTEIRAAGNSTATIDYTDQDPNPYSGISYYRLKQTDFNGQYTYSSLAAVNYYFGEDGISIYPNPGSPGSPINLDIKGLKDQEILVVLRDMSGKEFYSKVIITSTDDQLEAIDTEQRLSAGTYIVIASSNNRVYSQKIIIK